MIKLFDEFTEEESRNFDDVIQLIVAKFYKPFWLEDPKPAENQEGFSLIRSRTTVPLAVGEIFSSIWDAKTLIERQLVDYIRSTIVHAGGITHLKTIAALAGLYQVRTGFHGATDISPVTLGAALHFDTWVSNFGIQEYVAHCAETQKVFPHDHRYESGFLHVSETPGHGVTINEAEAALCPYSPAYLPTNRPMHGTVWSW